MKNMLKQTLSMTLIASAAILLNACGNAQMPAMQQLPRPIMMNAQNSQQMEAPQVIVRFQADASRTDMQLFNNKYALQTQRFMPELNAYIMVLRQPVQHQVQLQSLLAQMGAEPVVALVELNQRIQTGPVNYDMYISPIFN